MRLLRTLPSAVPGVGPHCPQPRVHLVAGTALQLPGHNVAVPSPATKQHMSLKPKVIRDMRCELRNESGYPVNGHVFSLMAQGLPENQALAFARLHSSCRCVIEDAVTGPGLGFNEGTLQQATLLSSRSEGPHGNAATAEPSSFKRRLWTLRAAVRRDASHYSSTHSKA